MPGLISTHRLMRVLISLLFVTGVVVVAASGVAHAQASEKGSVSADVSASAARMQPDEDEGLSSEPEQSVAAAPVPEDDARQGAADGKVLQEAHDNEPLLNDDSKMTGASAVEDATLIRAQDEDEAGDGQAPAQPAPADLASVESQPSEQVPDDVADETPSYEETHVNMYRLYNPNSGEHFYTADIDEATSVATAGWQWEGVGWVAPTESLEPVFRLYNPNAGDHHYTLDQAERDGLVALGWNFEGIGWYSDGADQLAVLRQYNPNADSGTHNFTINSDEDMSLGSAGWSREGIAWYATDGDVLEIIGRWLVTAAWGATERYWIDSFGNIAASRFVQPEEGAGYLAYATGSGAVVRGKHDRGDGYTFVADNEGRLATTEDGADGWLVTDAYDGGLQRYRYVASEHAMRSGFFQVDGARYFGVGGEGYVLRGKAAWGDHVLLADNEGRLATGEGWLVTDVYDGVLQRYWLEYVWQDYSGARAGLFDAEGSRYFGVASEGYVVRNRHLFGGDRWYYANNDGVLADVGNLEMKDIMLAILDFADASSQITVFGETGYSLNSGAGARLTNAVNALRGSGFGVGFIMMDLVTGCGVACSPDDIYYSASTIKGPYVAAINHFAPGSVDGSTMGAMDDAIRYSSNEDYASLRSWYGGGVMQSQLDYCNVHTIDAGSWYVDFSARDLAKLWLGSYWYFYQDTNENSEWCRSLYTDGAVEENALIHNALADRYLVHAKPGWYPGSWYDVQNDAGIVMAGDHPYVVSILSSAYGQYGSLEELARAIDDVHSDMIW